MLKKSIAFLVLLGIAAAISAQKAGPIADRIVFDVQKEQSGGLRDTLSGKSDLSLYSLDGRSFRDIQPADRAKLDIYAAASGSWSLMLNPVPNKAPYTVVARDGQTRFNPLAIRELRYAMNWLIDRKKIVDEILLGEGEPMFTPLPPSQPGAEEYGALAASLGMREQGDERKAIADIGAAMEAASQLPANKGRLLREGQFWNFNGQPVTITILLRSDDPSGLLPEGSYLADQIEKAGIRVLRQETGLARATELVYRSNPADLGWGIYTEGRDSEPAHAWWDPTIGQAYAPFFGNMAGGSTEGFWNYRNDEIDELAQKGLNGWLVTEDEYRKNGLRATELGMRESARIFVASQVRHFAANKARFNARMLYGRGDGLNAWSLRSANVAPKDNERLLRVSLFSPQGDLFAGACDPVGIDGFSGPYSSIIEACSDMSTAENPGNAREIALRARWDPMAALTKIAFGRGAAESRPRGLIPVQKDAVIFDSNTGKWVSGVAYRVAKGKASYTAEANARALSRVTSTYLYGQWHSGRPVTVADLMYAIAFRYDWATKDGSADRNYDEAYSARYRSSLSAFRGVAVNRDGSFTSYYDSCWPMDMGRVAAGGVMSPKAGNPDRGTVVPWEITEALAKLVTEGSKSGTVYTFSSDSSKTEVDVISPSCVADIRAKLDDFIARKYVPESIRQWVKLDQAVARYRAAIGFIDKNHNAYISNGPFYISKVDPATKELELTAFRDVSYPFKSDYWLLALRMEYSRVDELKLPATAQRTKDLPIDVTVSRVVYPDDGASPAGPKTRVTLSLQLPDGEERHFAAKYMDAGSFRSLIPARELADLKPGDYTVIVTSALGKNDSPAVSRATLSLF